MSKNRMMTFIASVFLVVVCIIVFIGSTFAWFTDSSSSGRNRIVTGNLDVGLYVKNGENYIPVTADTNLFSGSLWEPGHVEVVNFKITNLGSLALKYKLGINVANETPSTNVNGNSFRLSDYIKFVPIDGEQNYLDRESALVAAESASPVSLSSLSFAKEEALNPDSSTFVTLIVYMPITVGNEINYRGDAAPEVDFGVTLVATQSSYEADSFDSNYDDSASLDGESQEE